MQSREERSTAHSALIIFKGLLLSTRPKQWTKNLIIYFALFFSAGEAWHYQDIALTISLLGRTTSAFILFSALTGAVYLLNDILDTAGDRHHPTKCLRPIASGQVPLTVAWATSAGLAVTAFSLSFLLFPAFALVAFGYLLTMVAYSVVLKHIVLIDVFAISAGFVLRAVAGATVLQVPISPWLYICTALGALLIALSKRRSELVLAGNNAGRQRDTLGHYTTSLIDQLIAIVAPSTLLVYILYTFTAFNVPENQAMMLTIPFVAYGLFRYIYLVHVKVLGENPEDILVSDMPLITSIALWLATAATVLVVFRS